MSVVFGTVANSDRVDFGSGSSLDGLFVSGAGVTWMIWCYRTSTANNQHALSKDGASPFGPSIVFDDTNGAGTCEPRLFVGASVSASSTYPIAGTSKLRSWECIGASFVPSTAAGSLAIGTETAAMRQPAYGGQILGNGANVDDSAYSLYAGNLPRSATLPFYGSVAWVGVYPRVLTLREMEMWRRDTLAGRVPRVSGARLLSRLGGQQLDLSGNGNHGTRTGSLLSAHEPRARTRSIFVPVSAPAGGAITGSSAVTITPTGALTGAGALAGTAANTITPTGTLAGAGALAGSAALAFTATGSVSGDSPVAGTAALTLTPTGTLTGAGELLGAAAVTITPTATLVGAGALAGSSAMVFGASLTPNTGATAGSAVLAFSATGTLTGAGALAGTAALTLDASLTTTPVAAAATSARRAVGRNYIIKGRRYYNVTNEELAYLIARDLIDLTREDIKVSYQDQPARKISRGDFAKVVKQAKKVEPAFDEDEESAAMLLL